MNHNGHITFAGLSGQEKTRELLLTVKIAAAIIMSRSCNGRYEQAYSAIAAMAAKAGRPDN